MKVVSGANVGGLGGAHYRPELIPAKPYLVSALIKICTLTLNHVYDYTFDMSRETSTYLLNSTGPRSRVHDQKTRFDMSLTAKTMLRQVIAKHGYDYVWLNPVIPTQLYCGG
jgi:hypothetical protein